MRIAVVLAAVLAIACSKKDEPSAAKAEPAPSPATAGSPPPRSATPGGVPAGSFVPETILSRLGDARFVAAIDFTKARRITATLPDAMGCIRDVIDSAALAVVGVDASGGTVGVVTRVPRRLTLSCLASWGFEATEIANAHDAVQIGDVHLDITWQDDMAIVTTGLKGVTGAPSRQIRDLIAVMPPHAFAWQVVDDSPYWKTRGMQRGTSSVVLVENELAVRGTVESTKPGAARKVVTEVLDALEQILKPGGILVPDRWIKISSTETNAAFEVTIPLAGLPPP